ncbi:histidine phosphatase family protein [Nocardioides aestuarii]|uniref:SixA phosphatase family protein n=1 Tax=Nocardioides aestuarii TaxID=252231 RepID=A0ABW4TKL7_9ACTN
MTTLVVVRHAKSDWSGSHADRDRPLAPRGRRQAAEAGRWLAAHGPALSLAVVSPAERARATWGLVSAELAAPPEVRVEEAAYTFDGSALHTLVAGVEASCFALVGHNPAVEELVLLLTGHARPMPTSSLAVIDVDAGTLLAHGRPPS